MRLITIDFEVFGHVQGVFFRKFTRQTAQKYSIVGWCKNTNHGTVSGQAQGQEDNVNKMKQWLQHEGSPHSKIDKAEFRNEKEITKLEFDKFSVDH
uniref:Acylphosphatase n=1 Tax=Plectus sambesii TaxID=2011161 RepID=A0A914WKP1_9BILA